MSLLPRDFKLGLVAGGVLLALGAGYLGVLSLFADPPADPLADANTPAVTPDEARDEAAYPVEDAAPMQAFDDTLSGPAAFDDVVAVTPADAVENDSRLNVEAARGTFDVTRDDRDSWGALLPTGPVTTTTGQPAPTAEEPPATPAPEAPADAFADATEPAEPAELVEPAAYPKQHTVASGDNFSTISQRYYGTSKHFKHVADANPQFDPRRLNIGDVLTIPAPPAE